MLVAPFAAALEVSEQIKDLGAYAGIASVLGLAVLSLLYFGQARELKRLREWAGRAPERTAELQAEAEAAAAAGPARRVQAQPVPAVASVAAPVPVATRPPAAAPATAAGAAVAPVGTPLTAAGVPVGTVPGQETQAIPAVAGAGPPADVEALAAPEAAEGATGDGTDTDAVAVGAPPVPAARPAPAVPPRPATALPVTAAGAPRRRPGDPVAEKPEERSTGRTTLAIVGGVLVTLVLVVVLATQVIGGDEEPTTTTGATQTATTDTDENQFEEPAPPADTGASGASGAGGVTPSEVSIFVLNGTTQNGIAGELSGNLETAGFQSVGTDNAAVNTERVTKVFFTEGNRAAARDVARRLQVSNANVLEATPGVKTLAAGAEVIVQIGADKATP